MLSRYSYIILLGILISLSSKGIGQSSERLEITRTDSTRDHFVLRARSISGKEIIVLIEKEKVVECYPLRKFIIADSIHQTSVIKAGNKKDLAGFYLSTIDGIKIRNSNELIKIVNNCKSFTDQ